MYRLTRKTFLVCEDSLQPLNECVKDFFKKEWVEKNVLNLDDKKANCSDFHFEYFSCQKPRRDPWQRLGIRPTGRFSRYKQLFSTCFRLLAKVKGHLPPTDSEEVTSTTSGLTSLHWLPVQLRTIFELLLLRFKALHVPEIQ